MNREVKDGNVKWSGTPNSPQQLEDIWDEVFAALSNQQWVEVKIFKKGKKEEASD
jgi:hypothetical protein